jgi:hypothetical protein
MADSLMPANLIDWMQVRNWGQHHVQWHAVRQWDLNDEATQQWMLSQGWHRADRQEGQPGNGFDFLVMHRAMLELLRETFPEYAALLAGWPTPPTNPNNPADPLPNGAQTPFDPRYQQAIGRIETPPDTFATEDEWGLFVETSLRPVPGDPFRRSPDPASGIHNYIHNRFSDLSSPVDMGNPGINLGNQRFWRLHGWIDTRWSAYRRAKGLSDQDPAYRQAVQDRKDHLRGHMVMRGVAMGDAAIRAIARAAVVTLPAPPFAVSHPFQRTLSREFTRLGHQAPAAPSLDDLEDLLQLAIMVEHFTIPLYLCALWSIKIPATGPAPYPEVRRILRNIVLQEMLHMGIVCNLLIAIGRKPRILESVPHYPSCIPGILTKEPIGLERISKPQVGVFQKIEQPEFPPVPIRAAAAAAAPAPRFKTIGEMYTTIANLFQALADAGKLPQFVTQGQLSKDFGGGSPPSLGQLKPYGDLPSAKAAIDLIKQQGEGTSTSGGAPGPAGTIAHFYLFGQVLDEVTYVLQQDGSLKRDPSKPVPFPKEGDIWAMAPIPEGGYPGTSDTFDQAYSDMLRLLETAWGTAKQQALDDAVTAMRLTLRQPAVDLMMKPRLPPYGPGNYGPSFRFLPPAAAPAPGAAAQPHYQRIQQILDQAVHGNVIGAHGPFWRTLDRDGFVNKSVFGVPLIVKNAAGKFDPDLSNLVLALEGKPPFDGSSFPRMPVGYPPVPQAQIGEIRKWITDGCPA